MRSKIKKDFRWEDLHDDLEINEEWEPDEKELERFVESATTKGPKDKWKYRDHLRRLKKRQRKLAAEIYRRGEEMDAEMEGLLAELRKMGTGEADD